MLFLLFFRTNNTLSNERRVIKMLFKKFSKNFEVAETVVQQMNDNTEMIGELLRQQYELNNFISDVSEDLFDIVSSQQKAIKDLQTNIVKLQKLTRGGEAN